MKKFLTLIIVLLFTVSCKVNAEGLLPVLTDIYGVKMPSFAAVAHRFADTTETMEDGSSRVMFKNVSDSYFDAFSDYLDEYGCELINYSLNSSVFNATIGKQGASFTLSFDQAERTLTLVYPQGTNEEDEREAWIRNVKVGSAYTFGLYEQDNDASNGRESIEWIVLEIKDDGSLLLISRYGLDCKKYNETKTSVTWETCSLRKWLNSDFYNAAFSDEEKVCILTATVTADKNPEYNTNQGNTTEDKVYLLSITEVNKYFESDAARLCAPTKYARARGAQISNITVDGVNTGSWWFRSSGSFGFFAAGNDLNGSVNTYGYIVNNTIKTVRPVICVRPY